ncbi:MULTISPECIES: DEAD/DEAH box helicase family protein [unclassified Myroides]|uniref:DEAD/DEAH box helicase family protein n=1 Tax=unclassified Myroides TaxID=2642485 RepID=UPI003D2F870E
MKQFPTPIAFKYPWRAYQKKVLDQLDIHLNDDKLHLVAPPGSGKTVLGLEVILRLNQPTLILAPTLAVKNQWIDRFCSLFLQVDEVPDWISTQLTEPKFLTVSTYQGLHAAFNYLREEEVDEDASLEENTVYTNVYADEVIKKLQRVGVQTLLVDEVHHLRKEWWKALDLLDNKLKPTIVGLTATPPYGATSFEWQRYMELAGPVDEEIAVPTLLEVGDLCPHQDFIYYCTPLAEEREKILAHKTNVYDCYTTYKSHPLLVDNLKQLPLFNQPLEHLDWIYENLTTYVACLVYLKDSEQQVNKTHLKVLGLSQDEIPSLDLVWFEKVLNFYCFQGEDLFQEIPAYATMKGALIRALKSKGLVAYRQVQLVHDSKGDDLLLSSLSKLESIGKILDFEYATLGDTLRMAILTDYIRKEYYSTTGQPPAVLGKLGVMSIFETLRRQQNAACTMAVLTGSIVILPAACLDRLQEKATEKEGVVAYTPVVYDSSYVSLQLTARQRGKIVHWMTQLVEEGAIKVLIGTKSLLGEGWDAPAINSLVMASSIGAFITSNQVRGRAFRINPLDPEKTANIWHLACIDEYAKEGGKDWEIIHRRFQTFVGISTDDLPENVFISNGIERLGELKARSKFDPAYVEAQNTKTLQLAQRRNELKDKWLAAIQQGTHLTEGVKVLFSSPNERRDATQAKRFYTNKTLVSALFTLLCSAIFFVTYQVVGLGRGILLHGLSLWSFGYWFFQTFVLGLGLRFGWKGWKYFKMYQKFGDIRKDVQQIGEALCNTLCHFNLISTAREHIQVVTEKELGGGVFCSLEGATLRESHVFASCMKELLSPIENPRYVLERKTLLPIQDSETDFHAVPDCLGVNRERVNYFAQQWTYKVGRNRIVYTRTPEGRKELLQARITAIVNQLEEPTVKQEHHWL